MPGPEQVNTQISVPKGQAIAGNVANASTYNFPVHYKILRGSTIPQILSADPTLLDLIVEGGRELEKQGVRAIVGACGYFGNYQKEVAEILDVPVFDFTTLINWVYNAVVRRPFAGLIQRKFNAMLVDT